MLFWLGLGLAAPTGGAAWLAYVIAFAFTVGGLLSSTLHLGNPQRAWRAFSQWQTSWLSREGVLAVAALPLMGLHALGALGLLPSVPVFGWIGALLCGATVFATSMIYAQLKTVPRWNHWTVPALFLSLSLTGGALLTGLQTASLLGLLISGGFAILHWRIGDTRFAAAGSTLSTATRLADEVRSFEPPHTGTNYLLKEMVHEVGRAHASKLRMIALALLLPVPLLLCLVAPNAFGFVLASLSHLVGAFASRWLFFAEAEHVVGLYYGKR